MSSEERLNWQVGGSVDAPPLVLVHGLCESLRVWEPIVAPLVERYRVMRVDLLGFGDSPQARYGYTIEEQSRALTSWLRERGIASATLVGHSMGGSVVTATAELAPELARALVLVNAPPTKQSRRLSRAERALRTVVLGEAAWALMGDRERRRGIASAFAPGFPVPEVFVEDLARTSHAAFSGASFGLDRYLDERPLADRIASLGLPTTVIFGLLDQRVDASCLEPFDRLENVRVERLESSGHSPMWEQPELTARLIGSAAASSP